MWNMDRIPIFCGLYMFVTCLAYSSERRLSPTRLGCSTNSNTPNTPSENTEFQLSNLISTIRDESAPTSCGVMLFFGDPLYCPRGFQCCSETKSTCCPHGAFCINDDTACLPIRAIVSPLLWMLTVIACIIGIVFCIIVIRRRRMRMTDNSYVIYR